MLIYSLCKMRFGMSFMNWNIPFIQPLADDLVEKLQQDMDHKTKPPGSPRASRRISPAYRSHPTIDSAPFLRQRCSSLLATLPAAEGISPYPTEVTAQMVANFLQVEQR